MGLQWGVGFHYKRRRHRHAARPRGKDGGRGAAANNGSEAGLARPAPAPPTCTGEGPCPAWRRRQPAPSLLRLASGAAQWIMAGAAGGADAAGVNPYQQRRPSHTLCAQDWTRASQLAGHARRGGSFVRHGQRGAGAEAGRGSAARLPGQAQRWARHERRARRHNGRAGLRAPYPAQAQEAGAALVLHQARPKRAPPFNRRHQKVMGSEIFRADA
jgi:hypothetical protein